MKYVGIHISDVTKGLNNYKRSLLTHKAVFRSENKNKNDENYNKLLHVSIHLKVTNDTYCPNIDSIRLVSSGEKDLKQVWRQKIYFRSQKLQKIVIFRNFRFSKKVNSPMIMSSIYCHWWCQILFSVVVECTGSNLILGYS